MKNLKEGKIRKGVIVYARTARRNQCHNPYQRGDELDRQQDVCRKYSKERDLNVLAVILEIGDGTDFQRPGLQALLSYCEDDTAGTVSAIIITKPECLMSDVSDYVDLSEML